MCLVFCALIFRRGADYARSDTDVAVPTVAIRTSQPDGPGRVHGWTIGGSMASQASTGFLGGIRRRLHQEHLRLFSFCLRGTCRSWQRKAEDSDKNRADRS